MLGGLELGADAVLFADKNELPRRHRIGVAQKIMHPEPGIVQAELREIIAVDGVGIKIVILQFLAEALPLLVFAPEKTEREKEGGRDDGGDHVDRDVIPKSVGADEHGGRMEEKVEG
ncbi:MAG: hypothetical protein ABIU29_08015 [Chthoniobacterales bacterium]